MMNFVMDMILNKKENQNRKNYIFEDSNEENLLKVASAINNLDINTEEEIIALLQSVKDVFHNGWLGKPVIKLDELTDKGVSIVFPRYKWDAVNEDLIDTEPYDIIPIKVLFLNKPLDTNLRNERAELMKIKAMCHENNKLWNVIFEDDRVYLNTTYISRAFAEFTRDGDKLIVDGDFSKARIPIYTIVIVDSSENVYNIPLQNVKTLSTLDYLISYVEDVSDTEILRKDITIAYDGDEQVNVAKLLKLHKPYV